MKNKSRYFVLALLIVLGTVVIACRSQQPELTKAVLSLDWVPNTNHTGFYVALDKGWYAEEGIDLEIQVPSDPSAALKQVAAGNTEFGVSFEDELILGKETFSFSSMKYNHLLSFKIN